MNITTLSLINQKIQSAVCTDGHMLQMGQTGWRVGLAENQLVVVINVGLISALNALKHSIQ